jgi:hypothetical protein
MVVVEDMRSGSSLYYYAVCKKHYCRRGLAARDTSAAAADNCREAFRDAPDAAPMHNLTTGEEARFGK